MVSLSPLSSSCKPRDPAILIQMTQIEKVYRMGEVSVHALGGIDLTIRSGEFVCVVGVSGSGKTTLLDILGCLARPTSGSYLLKGQDMAQQTDTTLSKIRNRTIGFVFQTFHLMERHTALANVEVALLYAGLPRAARLESARKALLQVGLADRIHHRPHQLSGGQQQRVAIARALVNGPDLILADEPTGNLDSTSGAQIVDILLKLNQEGHTLLLVTHDPRIAGLAPRCITMCDGRIISDMT